jgi:hypothetical protein
VSAVGGGDEPVSSGAFVPLRTTVMRTVEAYEQGRVVVKRPAVVKTIAARPVTVLQTSTIHTPGGTKVVTRSTYRTVKSVITTKLTSTLTQSETQTATATATVTRTATAPSDTVTVTITVTTTKGP